MEPKTLLLLLSVLLLLVGLALLSAAAWTIWALWLSPIVGEWRWKQVRRRVAR